MRFITQTHIKVCEETHMHKHICRTLFSRSPARKLRKTNINIDWKYAPKQAQDMRRLDTQMHTRAYNLSNMTPTVRTLKIETNLQRELQCCAALWILKKIQHIQHIKAIVALLARAHARESTNVKFTNSSSKCKCNSAIANRSELARNRTSLYLVQSHML